MNFPSTIEVIRGYAVANWEKLSNLDDNPPTPTVEILSLFCLNSVENNEADSWKTDFVKGIDNFSNSFFRNTSESDNSESSETELSIEYIEQLGKEISSFNATDFSSDQFLKLKRIGFVTSHLFFMIGLKKQEPQMIEKSINDLTTVWQQLVNEPEHKTLTYPLSRIIKAWQQEVSAKPITVSHDKRHPAFITTHALGSIRELNFIEKIEATSDLPAFTTPESESQFCFDFTEGEESILPPTRALDIATPLGVPPKTKSGAVHHTIRIFYEVLMAREPQQTKGDILFSLGDLIKYLYPDGKFHRTNQLPYIIQGLRLLDQATVPFRNESGIQPWRPIFVKSPVTSSYKNEDKIFIRFELPPDAKNGILIEKYPVRILGKTSAPLFNAYLTACDIFNQYGTQAGNIIDPTRPIMERNGDGHLIHPDTHEVILNERGKPIDNPYHPGAIAELPRDRNPQANQYPVLSFKDLTLACRLNPNDRKSLARARHYWSDLEKNGYVRLELEKNGWRILPSASHIQRFRGVSKAAKVSKKKRK